MSGGHFDSEMVLVDQGPVPEDRIEQLREMSGMLEHMGLNRHAANVDTIVRMLEMANSSEGYDLPAVMPVLDKYAAGDIGEETAIDIIEETVEA